ncbi:MAG: ArsC family reductase [Alphaproteobacteria bacterium]|nr:MAG: ArsC family reductase [Alphaproteobacteria bacterium]
MTDTTLYGIKNCDTMKKAFKWLEVNGVDVTFHDYKKQGIDEDVLRDAVKQHGWENVINRRGTTWRKLPDDVKEAMDDVTALRVTAENPSIIKRPLLVHKGNITLGFKDAEYTAIFNDPKHHTKQI